MFINKLEITTLLKFLLRERRFSIYVILFFIFFEDKAYYRTDLHNINDMIDIIMINAEINVNSKFLNNDC
jgi:hypothetical protein